MTKLSFSILVLAMAASLGGCARWSTFETANAGSMPVATRGEIDGGQAVAHGTPVQLVLTHSIDSEDGSASGASFVVLHDVLATDGSVVIPAGSPASVRVSVRGRRRLGRPAQIRLEAEWAMTPSGTLVRLEGEASVRGQSRAGLTTGMTLGMSLVYFPLNVLHLLHRGDAVEMQSGFVIQTTVGV